MIELLGKQSRELEVAITSEAPVLIQGPTGSGKSRLAFWIHAQSSRADRLFHTVNLASLAEGTFESELFGHERGAFTGAVTKRTGRLQAAQGGTLFLDEIGELSLRQQARLLEFLQSRRVTPIGSNTEVVLNLRVIAATNLDLEREVAAGRFRQDLFHRIRFISITLPALWQLRDSFDTILHRVLHEVCLESGRTLKRIDLATAAALEAHQWPGNYRELRTILEYAVMASRGECLELDDLPFWFRFPTLASRVEAGGGGELGTLEMPLSLDYQSAFRAFERAFYERALAHFRGRITRTARAVGVSKTSVLRRVREYGLAEGVR